METRLTRPKLEQLWRVLLTTLEGLGTGDAPALARSLAIAALTGRPAEANGVRVERRGEDVLVIRSPRARHDPDPSSGSARGTGTGSVPSPAPRSRVALSQIEPALR
jgi:hypothetical protein